MRFGKVHKKAQALRLEEKVETTTTLCWAGGGAMMQKMVSD